MHCHKTYNEAIIFCGGIKIVKILGGYTEASEYFKMAKDFHPQPHLTCPDAILRCKAVRYLSDHALSHLLQNYYLLLHAVGKPICLLIFISLSNSIVCKYYTIIRHFTICLNKYHHTYDLFTWTIYYTC